MNGRDISSYLQILEAGTPNYREWDSPLASAENRLIKDKIKACKALRTIRDSRCIPILCAVVREEREFHWIVGVNMAADPGGGVDLPLPARDRMKLFIAAIKALEVFKDPMGIQHIQGTINFANQRIQMLNHPQWQDYLRENGVSIPPLIERSDFLRWYKKVLQEAMKSRNRVQRL